ncbi:unnamed protein product [Rhizophagus irregularis]|nr:unnamed protein product [Rhizophagus irregularis]
MQSSNTNNEEKLAAGKQEKDLGNEYFKKGEVTEALRHYHQALLHLHGLQNNKTFAVFRKEQEEEPKKDPIQEEIMKTTSVIYSNIAACLIKNQKWSRAIDSANKALKNDPDNTKALFRRAQAYINEGNTTRAREDLEKLSAKNPEDAAVKREWHNLRLKDKEQDEKQRRDLKGMFERKWKSEEKEEGEKKSENKDEKLTSTAAGSSKTSAMEPRFIELDDVNYKQSCLIKNQKWSRAIDSANKALKNDPDNTKALFRRAQAYINEGNTTRAREDLEKLSAKNPEDAAVKREWHNLRLKDKEQDEKQRRDLKGMFERKWKSEEKEEGEKKSENKDEKLTSTAAGSSKTSAMEPRFIELDE